MNYMYMRKFLLTALVTIGMIGSSVAQMAIPGVVFADNAARFNGRKVTLKNVQVDMTSQMSISTGAIAPAPLNGPTTALTPGTIGPVGPTSVQSPCRPPRGFSKVDIKFLEKPEFKTCFFMSDVMYNNLKREAGGQSVDAQITFRGDSRTGYNVTFYRLGM